MHVVSPELNEYMLGLLPARDAVRKELEEYARERNFPIVGPLVGNFFAQIAALIGARRIMELGSGFGYSALWFADALPEGGEIICTDGDGANRERAEEAFRRAGVADRIRFHTGDALTLFAGIEGDFDLIFCDIDKHGYPDAFHAAWPRLRPGGVLLFDNALWSGRMLEGDESPDTRGVVELNRLAFSTPQCRASLVPIRDGLLLCTHQSG
ncbi:MAG: O-methyltransferase [Bacteroidetes bacterium]|nr:O-methyltransferase [Bacteroidota bacterium]